MSNRRRVKLLGFTGGYGDDYGIGGSSSYNDDEGGGGGGLLRLMICDLVLAFLWVLTLAVIDMVAGGAWLRNALMYVVAWFLFAWLGIATEGGLFNPHTTLAASLSGEPQGGVATLLLRIPAQVAGYVLGVKVIMRTIPEYQEGPQLNVSAILGVIIEGSLSFLAVIVYRLLTETGQGFFTKNFISSITMLTLQSFGSSFTGGLIDPGYAFGWAYARGVHTSAEHLLVYWLAPMASTLFGSWAYDHVVHPDKHSGRFNRAAIRWRSD